MINIISLGLNKDIAKLKMNFLCIAVFLLVHSSSLMAKTPMEAGASGGVQGLILAIFMGIAVLLYYFVALFWKVAKSWWSERNVLSKNNNRSTISSTSISKYQDEHYEIALTESSGNKRKRGLWAKCLVEADGDKDTATARYIKYRVEQLSHVEALQIPIEASSVNEIKITPKKTVAEDDDYHYVKLWVLYGCLATALVFGWNFYHQEEQHEALIIPEVAAPAAEPESSTSPTETPLTKAQTDSLELLFKKPAP